MSNYLNLD